MQNIPSHALDIRHCFRATPERDYLIHSEVDDEKEESFVVDNGHQVYTEKGLSFVTELKAGDILMSLDNGKEMRIRVNKLTTEGTSTRICYDVI